MENKDVGDHLYFPNADEPGETKSSGGFLSLVHSTHALPGKEEFCSKFINGSAKPREEVGSAK